MDCQDAGEGHEGFDEGECEAVEDGDWMGGHRVDDGSSVCWFLVMLDMF